MTSDESPRFSAEDVVYIASKLAKDDATFVIGGQATNLWAWFYKPREPKLQSFIDPLTSKDIDYFGTREAAQAFAEVIGGELLLPTVDDMNTPNTAVVRALFNGKELVVDFMHDILVSISTNFAMGYQESKFRQRWTGRMSPFKSTSGILSFA